MWNELESLTEIKPNISGSIKQDKRSFESGRFRFENRLSGQYSENPHNTLGTSPLLPDFLKQPPLWKYTRTTIFDYLRDLPQVLITPSEFKYKGSNKEMKKKLEEKALELESNPAEVNFKTLKIDKKYTGMCVAIRYNKVVMSDKNIHHLIKKAEKKYGQLGYTITSLPEKVFGSAGIYIGI